MEFIIIGLRLYTQIPDLLFASDVAINCTAIIFSQGRRQNVLTKTPSLRTRYITETTSLDC